MVIVVRCQATLRTACAGHQVVPLTKPFSSPWLLLLLLLLLLRRVRLSLHGIARHLNMLLRRLHARVRRPRARIRYPQALDLI